MNHWKFFSQIDSNQYSKQISLKIIEIISFTTILLYNNKYDKNY